MPRKAIDGTGLRADLEPGQAGGLTSRAVVDRVARLLRRVKVGHAGTLDPLASGVLVVCVGAATRLIEYVQRMPKTYRTVVRLGAGATRSTPTGEVHGGRARRAIPDEAEVRAAVAGQVGDDRQRPAGVTRH